MAKGGWNLHYIL